MKNHTEVLIFHMAICAGASQISLDGRGENRNTASCRICEFLLAPSHTLRNGE